VAVVAMLALKRAHNPNRKAFAMPRISLPAVLQSAAIVGLAALAFCVWVVRHDGPLSAHASAQRPSTLLLDRTAASALGEAQTLSHAFDRSTLRMLNGWTVGYTVPAHNDERPPCAAGRYFTPMRVALGRHVVRGHWNAARDRIVYAGPRNPDDEQSGSVLFDGVRLWNGSGRVVTLEGACQ
jgi:hypothetical protein